MKLYSIQALRALAAAMVVVFHAAITVGDTAAPWGQAGVDIFFVISGFIMVHTAGEFPAGWPSVWRFLKARLRRIVPMYWLVTAAMVALLLVPGLMGENRLDVDHALASFAFIPWVNDVTGSEHPVLYVGWTLNIEMWFYAWFALTLFLPGRWRIHALVVALGGLVVAGLVKQGDVRWEEWTTPLMLEFLAGCLLARFMRGASAPIGMVLVSLGAAGFVASTFVEVVEDWRVLWWGLPALALVAGAVLWERAGLRTPRLLSSLGDSSYSLYLIHPILLAGMGKIVPHGLPALVGGTLACIIAGHAAWWLVERRIGSPWRAPRATTVGPGTPGPSPASSGPETRP